MADSKAPEKKVSYKDTLNLPRTDFPIRAHAAEQDPKMLKRWEQEGLYEKTFTAHSDKKKFVLHDGPPYANGHIHLGTAYNKLLKDIVAKAQRMFGKQVPITPGWDCHGLPIEWNVSKEKAGLSRTELKKACREYARKWVETQRKEFKELGVLMNWEHPYLTMDFSYEEKTVRAFGLLFEKGYIERKNKTVPWCPTCKTVLATAEIEHEERKDPSIYVRFPLTSAAEQKVRDAAPEVLSSGRPISLLVWTTTPWTLPLNRAVLLNPDASYVVLENEGELFIVGKALADQVCEAAGIEKNVVATISAQVVQGEQVHHPFITDQVMPILLDQSVELTEGTACVHCAPGCGPQDYEVALKNDLEVFSPISEAGEYTRGIMPTELEGVSVADGQGWVLRKLQERDALFLKKSVRHSYPHCWRCHGPLIWRATKQWFCDLTQHDLKQKTLKETKDIATVPEKGINRLRGSIEGRLEWCLSRQRAWGVPIPALLCNTCDYTYITKELIATAAYNIGQHGIDYWDTASVAELLPKDFSCPVCGGTDFHKEMDILDVWFDSGISHYAVLRDNPELRVPADLYLEAKDQTRGWFQSSLLTSMAIEGETPTKRMVIHGFTVDEKGRKMSKSLGNVVSPYEVIQKLGTDGLRLWSTTIDIGSDAVVSDRLLQNVQQVFRKIRNTARFLLSNLYDFDKKTDAVDLEQLRLIDRHALERLFKVNHEILADYQAYDISAVYYKLTNYCTVDLSSFYLDIIKDRLYVEQADGHARRSAQTVCWYILDTLTRLIAPILSFTAEQLSDQYQKEKSKSIHLQKFSQLKPVWRLLEYNVGSSLAATDAMAVRGANIRLLRDLGILGYLENQEQDWVRVKELRSTVLKAIEQLREQGTIKHSLEASVDLCITDPLARSLRDVFAALHETGQSKAAFFKELFIVSNVTVHDKPDTLAETDMDGLYVAAAPAQGQKCPRCWHWQEADDDSNLCQRCQEVVAKNRV